MSNRYEEVIRLVLDVETEKFEKKVEHAQTRANRKAQKAAETGGPGGGGGTVSKARDAAKAAAGSSSARQQQVPNLYNVMGRVVGQYFGAGRLALPRGGVFRAALGNVTGGAAGATPPPIPRAGLPAAGAGQALRAIGSSGAAGAAGVAGLVLISLKHLSSGIQKYTQAIGHWGKAFITGDASKALKGVVSYAQGMAHALGPVMGTVISKMLGVWHRFIDTLDEMVHSLARFNPIVSAQQRVYEVKQKMFQMRLAQVMQPLLSAWIELKSAVLDFMNELLPLMRPLVSIFAGIVRVFTGIVRAATWFVKEVKSVFVDVVAAFTWVRQSLMGIAESYESVRKRTQEGFEQRSLDRAAAKYTKAILGSANALAKWQQNESTRREKPLWQRATSGDGSVIPHPGTKGYNAFGSRRFAGVKDTLLKEWLAGRVSDQQYKDAGGDLEAARKEFVRRLHSPTSPARSNMAGLAPVWRGGRSRNGVYDDAKGSVYFVPAKRDDNPLRYVPATPNRPKTGAPGDLLVEQARANQKVDPTAKPKLPTGVSINFNQNVQARMDVQLALDAAVDTLLNQVREKFTSGINAARDEAAMLSSIVGSSIR
jgi:hypothetical protein